MTDATAYEPLLDQMLIDAETLQQRVIDLGAQISQDYSNDDNLLLICILRGGVVFLTDLMRALAVRHAIDFMDVSSYGVGARESSGQARIVMDLRTDITNRHVLLVEDIVDTGHTLSHVLNLLNTRAPASLKVCCLLDKHERREVEVPIDYVGFQIPNEFVFGYGLDLDEYWRNLPFIGVVKSDVYLSTA
ncbi:MAG: hypoxanthine phosphoribosyltransferase [Anaerolineales bacterium]